MAPDAIKQLAEELGFAACGICEARVSDYGRELRDWLDAGKHGEMAWLADRVEVRADPTKLVEGARSVIVVADALPSGAGVAAGAEQTGRIARYATAPDYHKTIKKRLHRLADAMRAKHPDHVFRACVDTAPILEREQAQRAGIGWVGKHTLTLNEQLGSHLLLGEIVTTLAIEPDGPASDHCGTCTRCIDACPTDAITPRSVDATRCISYLTIEHRSPISPAFFEAIGDWVFGCDICQDVCPYVQRAESRRSPPADRHGAGLPIAEVLDWTEGDRRAAFVGSAMKRAKLGMMKRNALIVAGNFLRHHEDAALRKRIEVLAANTDEPAIVAETARDVLVQLTQR